MTPATQDGQVGPIIFANQTARKQLVEHGEVVTFRKSRRTTGQTWWRKSRLGTKEGDVTVSELGKVDPADPDDLEPYRPRSGFSSIQSWQQAIGSLNDELPTEGWLYRVRLRDSNE